MIAACDPLVMKARWHGGIVPWSGVDDAITAAIAELADAGFDLVQTFDVATAAREPGWEQLAADAEHGRTAGLVVGNTRALWPRFVTAMRDPVLAAESDPLDRYTERTIEAAVTKASPGAPILYGHRQYAGAFLPFTRLAVATGLGSLARSNLVIHPIYGPWFALRAVILVPGDAPVRVPIASPCTCASPCPTALATALVSSSWEPWLAVRDACSLRAWRYSDEQVRYHYTKEWLPPIAELGSP